MCVSVCVDVYILIYKKCMWVKIQGTNGASRIFIHTQLPTIWRFENFENFEAAAAQGWQGPPAPVAKQSLGLKFFL